MACCVFMAIVITNMLVFYRKFKATLGIKTVEGDNLWQPPSEKRPLLQRSYKFVVPVVLLSTGVFFGAEHWQHMMQWLGISECSTADLSQCHAHHH